MIETGLNLLGEIGKTIINKEQLTVEIEKIQEQIAVMDDDNLDEILMLMAQQMKFEKVKLAMSEKLGRTII